MVWTPPWRENVGSANCFPISEPAVTQKPCASADLFGASHTKQQPPRRARTSAVALRGAVWHNPPFHAATQGMSQNQPKRPSSERRIRHGRPAGSNACSAPRARQAAPKHRGFGASNVRQWRRNAGNLKATTNSANTWRRQAQRLHELPSKAPCFFPKTAKADSKASLGRAAYRELEGVTSSTRSARCKSSGSWVPVRINSRKRFQFYNFGPG
jgi:hypothetical protein